MVDHWIRYYIYHCLGMLLSKLRQWQVRVRHLYQRYAYFPVTSTLSGAQSCSFVLAISYYAFLPML